MASKIKKSQILRHSVQLILFILLPGVYSMVFSEVKTAYQMIINGNFSFLTAVPSLVEFIAVMLLTIMLGRWFCGWICAFGAYNDLIYYISRKFFKVRFRVDEKVDAVLKYVKYAVLIVIIVISWTMESSILESTSPWDAFGQITDVSTVLSSLFIGLIFLILITIGAVFVERFFCRYLCPLGAIFSIISKVGIVKINKPKADCGKCRACTMNCTMGLPLYKVDCVKGGDCINCLKCTEVCYRNNANVNVLGKDVNENLAGSVAMATMLGVYGLANVGANALTNSGIISNQTEISRSVASSSAPEYKDGTYTGSGIGFKGRTTKVSVTIDNGKITSIETLSYGDDRPYYEKAEANLTKNIISRQSTLVDTVSGATFSSKGIISAVKDALSQASNSISTETKNETTTKTSNATESNKNEAQSTKVNEGSITTASSASNTTAQSGASTSNATSNNQGSYKDGTYTGSGKGFKGRTTTVSVTITGGKISNIETVSYGDDRPYYERASTSVLKNIISKQSTSVDTVSGATYSSKGIMSAVTNALSQAK